MDTSYELMKKGAKIRTLEMSFPTCRGSGNPRDTRTLEAIRADMDSLEKNLLRGADALEDYLHNLRARMHTPREMEELPEYLVDINRSRGTVGGLIDTPPAAVSMEHPRTLGSVDRDLEEFHVPKNGNLDPHVEGQIIRSLRKPAKTRENSAFEAPEYFEEVNRSRGTIG
jgi:hypothetical protein